MANEEQLSHLKQGIDIWTNWRRENPNAEIDLQAADLSELDLSRYSFHKARLTGANLSHSNLRGANFIEADLSQTIINKSDFTGSTMWMANISNADLRASDFSSAAISSADLSNSSLIRTRFAEADLGGANLQSADLSSAFLFKASLGSANLKNANLQFADLRGATLANADLTGAILTGADLSYALFVQTKMDDANLNGCRVYGCSVWDIKGTPASQKDLIISHEKDGNITTDDIEVAQFIYLLYDNKKIRHVINSITSKGVLILGRFTPPERKAVLDDLRNKLREFDLLPIVFDFDRPTDKDYTETVQTLAGMSLFVIVDVTNPKSTPLEMEATVKQFKIPFVPIIDVSVDQHPYAMIVDLQKNFHWVLKTVGYRSKEQLIENIDVAIIERARKKHEELRKQKEDSQDFLVLLDDMLKSKPTAESASEG